MPHSNKALPVRHRIARAAYRLISLQPEQVHNSLLRIEQNDPAAQHHGGIASHGRLTG